MKPRSLGSPFPKELRVREGGFNSTLIYVWLWGSCWAWGKASEVVGEGFGWAATHFTCWDALWESQPVVGWVSQRPGASSELFPIEMPVLMLSLQTRGSQVDAHPFIRCWGQACLGSCCSLVFASSPHRIPFAPVHPGSPGTQLQRRHCHLRWQMGLNWIVNKSEMRDKKTTQVLERTEQWLQATMPGVALGRLQYVK